MSRDDLTAKQMDEADELAQADTDRAVNAWIQNKDPMDLLRRLVSVNQQLAVIARKTGELAEQGLATPYSAQFIYYLVRQSELLKEAQTLIEAIRKAGGPVAG